MRMAMLVLLPLATLFAVPASAQSPDLSHVSLTVEAWPTHGLAMIPPSLKITVSNGGSADLALPALRLCLLGVGPDGSSFTRFCGDGEYFRIDDFGNHRTFPGAPLQAINVPAKQAFVTFITPDENAFFFDRAFLVPGNYDLRFSMDIGGASSNVIRYTSDSPSGENAVVAAAIRDRTAGYWNPYLDDALASIFATHAASEYGKVATYYKYALTSVPASDSAARLQTLIAAGLPGAFDTWARIVLAETEQQVAQQRARATGTADDTTVAFLDQGRLALESLAASQDPLSSSVAAKDLKTFPWSRPELQKWLDATHPKKISAIEPHADCVIRNPDASYTAWFGYTNRNNGVVAIEIGSDNSFSPEPRDRGQPSVFNMGEQSRAFAVNLQPGEQLKWILNGHVAVANGEGNRASCNVPTTP